MADGITEVRALRNRFGDDVPVSRIRPEHVLEHNTVVDLVGAAQALNALMKQAKNEAFQKLEAFMDTLRGQFHATKKPGTSGGYTLESFDQLSKVVVTSANTITFGPQLVVAREKINGCIAEWSQGANENIQALVDDAFKTTTDGKVRVDLVLGLRRLNIKDEAWQDAMAALDASIKVAGSRRYIRFYTRKTFEAPWEQVPLDLSSL